MAELGLSDVSDVSDPELDESSEMLPPGGALKAKGKRKESESDWDSASDINTPRGPGVSRPRLSSTKVGDDLLMKVSANERRCYLHNIFVVG